LPRALDPGSLQDEAAQLGQYSIHRPRLAWEMVRTNQALWRHLSNSNDARVLELYERQ